MPRVRATIAAVGFVFLLYAPAPAAWFEIDQPVEVHASAATVWRVLTDLPAYPQWNPFVLECRSTLEVGAPIDMEVQLTSWFRKHQQETILEHVPQQRLCYGYTIPFLGALSSRRCHDLEPLGPDRVRYRSHFALSGWLAPIVQLLFGGSLQRGFHAMTEAVQQQAERVAASAPATGAP